ncbi:MAG: 3-deoxy-D-manno-octulosonic acid transferase [Paracoccaceae bacterium]|nr:3-deoxy-D-manno-octulosonic acid transferase [Paracoccaceae bacterium]
MRDSFALYVYLLFADILTGVANRKLEARLKAGKEDPNRINERRGQTPNIRPEGEVIWFHAASVGESIALLGLIENIVEERPLTNILITTGTTASANLINTRLPKKTIHQYVPLDVGKFVCSFLDHWKPNLAIFTESELWPCLIAKAHAREIPLILINARISRKSFSKWRWVKGLFSSILRKFDIILCQDENTAKFIRKLSKSKIDPKVVGSLKESAPPLPFSEEDRAVISNQIGSRPIWLAASTHEREELMMAEAHEHARRFSRRLLLIIVPRHPNRGKKICSDLRNLGWQVSLRSGGEEINNYTEIYIADTFGEMGLWYRISSISFLGGSMTEVGGHNPFEPATLGSAILHGPHVWSAKEAYEELGKVKASLQIKNPEELSQAIVDLLNPDTNASMAKSAWELSSKEAEASSQALNEIFKVLDHMGGN